MFETTTLDRGNLRARGPVADRIHHLCGLHREKSLLTDFDPGLCNFAAHPAPLVHANSLRGVRRYLRHTVVAASPC